MLFEESSVKSAGMEAAVVASPPKKKSAGMDAAVARARLGRVQGTRAAEDTETPTAHKK